MVLVARRRVVTLDSNVLHHGIVISVLHVRAVPADFATSPVNGTLAVFRETGRPERKLNPGRRLREMVLASRGIVSLVSESGPLYFVIDGPANVVRLPVNGVGMHFRLCVGGSKVLRVGVYKRSVRPKSNK